MNNQYINFLAKELLKEKLVIFVGAGASIDSNLPNWSSLVKNFAKELEIDKDCFTSEEILSIPETYYNRFGKVPYYELLENIFSKKYESNSIHEALEKLDVNYIITTNFDELIEKRLNENYNYDVIKKDEDLAHTSKRKMIIKMHGDLDNKNIVLKKSDFEEYESKFPLVSTFIKGLFTTNTILFIGYSLNDPNVKNIMSWIKNILKDDFRKVYLVEYDNDNQIQTEYEKNKIINKIILPNLTKEEGSTDKKKKLLEKKGELLKEFLETINKKKEKLLKKENIFIYSNLNYLTKINFQEFLKDFSICEFNITENGMLNNKGIKKFSDSCNLQKYSNLLIKSDIQKINDISINKIFKNDKNFKNLLNIHEKYNEFIELILKYDQNEFESFLKNNEWTNEEYISVSGSVFFEKYDIAKEKIMKILKSYLKENNKEKIVWTYFILNSIEILENNKNFDFLKKSIDLKRIYNKYFKRKTELYNEIIKCKTLEKAHEAMDEYLEKIKNSKKTLFFGGFNPLEKAQFLVRDIFKFNILNGISFKSLESYKITKKYIEILLISYTNSNEQNYFSKGILNLETFKYSDYYFMLQINYKDLSNLFIEYNIKYLKCDESVIDTLLITLKNILKLLNKDNFFNNDPFFYLLEKIFLLLNKSKLTKKQFNNFLEIFINLNKLNIIYNENFLCYKIQNIFNDILYKNEKHISKNKLKIIILNAISNTDLPNNKIIGVITYYYSEITSEKLKNTKKLENYFNRNSPLIKIYFLRLLDKNTKKIEIKKLVTALKNNFDLEIYKEILLLKYIKISQELENKIIPYLDSIFKKKYKDYSIYNNIFYILYSLLEKNYISEKLKNNLKNYNNENFIYYLKQNQRENEWRYFLEPKNFDYSCFTINNLKNFTEFGIKVIIEKGCTNKKFMKSIHKYLKLQSNNQIINGYLDFSFENIINKSSKK